MSGLKAIFGTPRPKNTMGVHGRGHASAPLSLPIIGVLAFLASAVVVAAVGAINYVEVRATVERQAVAASRTAAERMAGAIAAHLNDYSEAVGAVASDPAFARAVSTEDGGQVSARLTALGKTLPGAVGIRVVRPGTETVDATQTPPLERACLELASRAIGGGPLPAEAHHSDSEHRHWEIAHPIGSGETVIGSLLVALDLQRLVAWTSELGVDGAGIGELRQRTKSGRVVLARMGNGEPAAIEPAASQVANSRWEVVYWPDADMLQLETTRYGVPFALGFVALALIFAVTFGVASRLVRRDLMEFVSLTEDIWLNRPGSAAAVRLKESRHGIVALELALERLRRASSRPDAPANPGGARQQGRSPLGNDESD